MQNEKIIDWLSFFFFLSLITGCSTTEYQTNSTAPNIIYILADDLGYGELGSYGQEKIKTPHLDKLAAEGMRFTQHYSGSTVCAPSRCVLLTGKHTGHAYVRDNYELGGYLDEEEGGQLPLDTSEVTIAEVLKKEGYATGCVGKWGLGMADSTGNPNLHGFDLFYGYLCQKQAHNYYPTHLWENDQWDTLENHYFQQHQRFPKDLDSTLAENYKRYQGGEYAMDRMQERALQFVKEHKEEPFFLYYANPIPHLGLQIPEEDLQQYAHFEEEPYMGNRAYVPNIRPRATYAAMISRLDAQVGELMALLKKLDLEENTLVIFSSDNGATIPGIGGVDIPFFESHGELRGCKTNLYEGGIRVPTIVRWSGKIEAGTVSDHLSAMWDVFPTICEAVNISKPENLDGHSFLPTLLGKKAEQEQHDYLYWEFHAAGASQAVRIGDWKGIRMKMKTDENAPIELYDLKKDISESENVATKHPTVVAKIEEVMKNGRTASPIKGWNF